MRRTSKARKGGQKTVKDNSRTITRDVEVVNWVRRQIRAGKNSKEIVELSRTAEDWPVPGRPLSDGTGASVFTAIYFLEAQDVRFPLEEAADLKGRSAMKRRLGQLEKKKRLAQQSGSAHVFWETAYEVTKLTSLLEGLNIEDADLDEHGIDVLTDLLDDMVRLEAWTSRAALAVQARMGEATIRQRIAAMRAKTVENGATPAEAEMAQAMADRLERRLYVKLTA